MPISFSPLPSVDRIKELFDGDLQNGVLRWKEDNTGAKKGDIAGFAEAKGYRRVGIDGRTYSVHRILFKFATGRDPDEEIDHRCGTTAGDGISNLRPATRAQNNRNARLRKDNTANLKGVCRNSRNVKNPWRALIRIDGKQEHLGSFPTADAAHKAYCHAAMRLYGDFARIS